MRIAFSRPFLLLVAGIIMATLSATGAFALASDSVRSDTNYFVTGRSNHDLKAGVAPDGECATVTFDDVLPTTLEVLGAAYDNSTLLGDIAEVDICVRNVGDAATQVLFGFENIVNQEVTCAPGEADVDATCDSNVLGLPGELQNMTGVRVTKPFECTGAGGSVSAAPIPNTTFLSLSSPDPLGLLFPGGTCIFRVTFFEDLDTLDELAAAQTDILQFDMVFTGQDAP